MKRKRRPRQAGISAIEVVMLAPLVIGFVMLLVCFGVLVDARGNIQGAARDAARSGSLQRDAAAALDASTKAATADGMDGTCTGGWSIVEVNAATGTTTTAFAPGDLYTVQITCHVSLGGLDWFSLGTKTFVIEATAPLDFFRRSTP